ncbi:DUF3857 domain-containing protein [Fulvivirgaceae bacterium BMA12]|uniref:DUF3857 domain-containing protein n=1 Tax=Agaribacillus aureus TaxID=3051825 RepID=A0ABT8LJR9_9BACT|nr:DUF3857 domain-containing protein [Fulvivirgaceae bacterium BMA12]
MGIFSIVTYLSLFLTTPTGISADKYPVSDIPEELFQGANVVIRDFTQDFKVTSIGTSTTRFHFVVTILNENGKRFNTRPVYYDNDTKIHYIKGNLYNANGDLIKRLKKSEIRDQSAISHISIYEDNRVKIAQLGSTSYPYTVEFEYQTSTNGTLFYPTWEPISDRYVSLQKSTFQVTMPADLKLRYKEQNINQPLSREKAGDLSLYKWELKNLLPVKTEPWGLPFSQSNPRVYTAPSAFSMGGYQGDLSSWQSMGKWINQLNSGRDDLPEDIKLKLKEITAGVSSKREKIKKVYQFLQENTRYVSIQLGIGGWQPFKASFVADKGYGDCKALTNYTMAMLNSLDIKSHYTLVKAGKNAANIDPDFPSSRFNHAFLCVPVLEDTIWLECTSQTNPFGYLGTFTSDRDVLVITEEGGKIVRTPVYRQHKNQQITRADIHLDKEGNATVEADIAYTGLQYENDDLYYYLHQGHETQKKWLYENLDISGARIDKFQLDASGDHVPRGKKSLSLTVPKYASVNGKRIFLKPNMMNKIGDYPASVENRKSDVYIKTGSIDFDTLTYYLPEGYHAEFEPAATKHQSSFGEYTSEIKVEEDKVTFIRSLKIKRGTYPPESYQEFRDFLKKIVKSDQARIVFVTAT